MKKSARLSDSLREDYSHAKKAMSFFSIAGLMTVLFIMLSIPTSSAYGNPASSELHLRLHDNAFFTVVIGNQEYSQLRNHYIIGGLKPGRHFMQVVRYNVYYNGYGQSFHQPVVVFSGHINIKGRSRIFAMIDNRGRYRVTETHAMHHQGNPHYQSGYQAPGYGYGYGYMAPVMNHQAFAMLKNTMRSTSFDSSRLQIAEQAIAASNVTSAQVYELMGLLTFESNRLKLAQFAYAYTVDKQNYFMVNRAFTFNSSITKLNSYIAHNF
jgi:hypothetical protein